MPSSALFNTRQKSPTDVRNNDQGDYYVVQHLDLEKLARSDQSRGGHQKTVQTQLGLSMIK